MTSKLCRIKWFSKFSHQTCRIVGWFLQKARILKVSEKPPKNLEHVMASWTFVKGCLFTASDQSRCKQTRDVSVGSSMLDNIVQEIRYFCTILSSFVKIFKIMNSNLMQLFLKNTGEIN